MSLSRLRPLIFWCFVMAFFGTASLIIFYAFGYRYSFERGIFVYSGSITVSSLPRSINVTIDGKPLAEKQYGTLNDTIHITGLMPGEHELTLSAPGYRSWSKKTIIQSGISTEYWNVILTREDYPAVTLPNTAGTERIYPHPDNDLFALAKTREGETSVVVYDRQTQEGREVFSRPSAAFDFDLAENFEWSPSGKKILIPLLEDGVRSYYIVTIADGGTEKLSDIAPGLIATNVRWNAAGSEELLFIADRSLYHFDTVKSRTPLHLSENIFAYDVTDNYIYTASADTGAIARFRNDGSGDNQTDIAPGFEAGPFTGPAVLDVYDEERIALLERSDKKRLFFYNRGKDSVYPFREIGKNIDRFQFSNDGKKLLFANGSEISVYFSRDWEVQPRRIENETLQIARFSDPVSNVSWTEDYEHVLFTRGNTLKLIELDGRSGRAINDLKGFVETPSQVLTFFPENRLFVVAPNTDISSFVFPEPQGLFGE
ncbi:MAG: PEGA domain-containing protein [Undibacterium sp.]